MEEKVPLKSKLWLSGADSFCATLSGIVTGGGLTYFFTRWMGLETGNAATVWLLFGIWNAVNDPLFGYISDKTKSKLGRRKPYIRYGSPIYACVFILSWVNFPFAGNQWAMFAQMLTLLFLFDTLYTAIATALYVMPFEIAISNKARGSILLWKIVFSVFSLAVPLVLLPVIQPEPGESPLAFQVIMSAIGILAGGIIFTSTFFYTEKGYIKEQQQLPFLNAVVACFKNKSFVIFEVLSFSVIYIQTALMQGVLYYFAEFKAPMAACYSALAAGAVFGIVLWLKKQGAWGIRKCSLILCLVFSVSCFFMSFFGGNIFVAVVCFFITGFGFSGGMFLVPLMNGDVIDYDESVTSLRREGMYAGINSLVTKPAISFANAVFIIVIKAFGYVQQAASGSQPQGAKDGILIAWMLIPAALLLISFVSLIFYPLRGERWQNTKLQLKQKHEDKERDYIAALR